MPIYLSMFLSLLGCGCLFDLPVMYNGLGYPSQKVYPSHRNPYYKILHNRDLFNPHGRDPLG